MSRCRRDRTLDCHLGRRRREWLGERCGAEQGGCHLPGRGKGPLECQSGKGQGFKAGQPASHGRR